MRRFKVGDRVVVTQPGCSHTKQRGVIVAVVPRHVVIELSNGESAYVSQDWISHSKYVDDRLTDRSQEEAY